MISDESTKLEPVFLVLSETASIKTAISIPDQSAKIQRTWNSEIYSRPRQAARLTRSHMKRWQLERKGH